jgi:hypothetical protein
VQQRLSLVSLFLSLVVSRLLSLSFLSLLLPSAELSVFSVGRSSSVAIRKLCVCNRLLLKVGWIQVLDKVGGVVCGKEAVKSSSSRRRRRV